jgi:hypothetical protein
VIPVIWMTDRPGCSLEEGNRAAHHVASTEVMTSTADLLASLSPAYAAAVPFHSESKCK